MWDKKIYHAILALIYSGLLWLVQPEAAPFVAFALILIIFNPARSILIIALTTLLFQVFPDKLTFYYSYSQIQGFLDSSLPNYVTHLSWFTGLIGIITLFILIHLRSLLIFKLKLKSPFLWGMVGALGTFFILVWLVQNHFLNPLAEAVGVWVAVALSKYLWYFAYDLQNRQATLHKSWFERAAFYSQFWTFRLIAPTIPKGENFWTRFYISDSSELLKVRIRAIMLLVWAIFLKYLFDGFSVWLQQATLFGTLRIFTIDQMLNMVRHGNELSFIQVFLSGNSDNLLNLINIVVWGHVTVATIWFCGFKVPKNTSSPHLSRNPLDFFARINFYLKEAVFQIFYFPCFIRLKGWPLSLRVFISIFYAVSLGKFMLNYTKMVALILKMGILASLYQHAAYFIYCVLLTLLLYPFLLRALQGKEEPKLGAAKRLGYSFVIFIGYTAIRMFDTISMNDVSINTKLFFLFFGIRV